jgi:hypothetical protein
MMWSPTEALYRGQASNGTVITVDEEAMHIALKQAGKGIFETDWWVETLTRVLEHWGIFSKRWLDEATRVPRMHFRLAQSKSTASSQEQPATTGPLSSRITARKKEEGQ